MQPPDIQNREQQPDVKDCTDNCEVCGLLIHSEYQIANPGCDLCTDCADKQSAPPQ